MHPLDGSASHFATFTSTSSRFRRLAVASAVLIALLVSGGSWALSPAAAATADDTILGTTAPTQLVQHNDRNGVEVGTRFTARSNGTTSEMRFWKGADAVGPHAGSLWTAEGTKLAGATFSNESASGWQSATFDKTVSLKAGQTYVVSYYATGGRYAVTQNHSGASLSPDLSIAAEAGVFSYGAASRFPTGTYRNSMYWVDVVFETTAAPSPAPAPAPEPAPEPAPQPKPTKYSYLGQSWPDESTTGVPAGTALTPYTGPCTITTANTVIDKKEVKCDDLRIFAKGVVITKSLVHNRVYVDSNAGEGSFTITDSTVKLPAAAVTGIGDSDFTATRVEVTGGNRGIACYRDCTVKDSYVVGGFVDNSGQHHMSGIRVNTNSTLIHNTIGCNAPNIGDAGCSAAITGYPDFDPVSGNQILNNLILAGSGGYCVYGGSTAGKPFSGQTRDIVFRDNVWQKGSTGRGCWYGPVTSFDVNAPGNQWVNNRFDDGSAVAAAN
jgi:hypothetical protein